MDNFIFYNSTCASILLAGVLAALTACGGGDKADKNQTSAEKTALLAAVTAADTTTWTPCATEGGTCTFSGTRQVRYGNNGTYFTKSATGSIACTNAVFGDPLPTLAKSCSYGPEIAPAPAPTLTWTQCASEGGVCSFPGTQQVRYGNNGTYNTKTATGSIACTNAVFGDPLPTLAKYCWYASAATPPTPTWTVCATEGGQCNFPGTQQVRYGNNGTYFTKVATNTIACTNAVFGDPLPTLAKSCSYSAVTTSPTPPPPPPPSGGVPAVASAAGFNQLIFSDEFNTANISPDGGGTYRWYNGIWYESPSPMSRYTVANSVLTATVLPTDEHESWLTTLNRKGGPHTLFNLGYFEARIKWNNVMDNFSAWWLESSEHALVNENNFCEIDIFEAYPNYGSVFAGSVVDWRWPDRTINSNNVDQTPGVDYSQWHTYGLLWTTNTITWYLDGKAMHSWPTPNVCKTQKLFMIIGAQQHGHTQQVNVDVDYIRVYR